MKHQAFHLKCLLCESGSGHLSDCCFTLTNPDKVVKVDVLREPGGDSVHAEELRFSLSVGWGAKSSQSNIMTKRLKQAAGNEHDTV